MLASTIAERDKIAQDRWRRSLTKYWLRARQGQIDGPPPLRPISRAAQGHILAAADMIGRAAESDPNRTPLLVLRSGYRRRYRMRLSIDDILTLASAGSVAPYFRQRHTYSDEQRLDIRLHGIGANSVPAPSLWWHSDRSRKAYRYECPELGEQYMEGRAALIMTQRRRPHHLPGASLWQASRG